MASPVAAHDLRGRLRAATSDVHARLERRVALLDPGLDLARYRAVLAAFLGFHAPLEPRLAAAPLPPLPRAARLEADLAFLGATAGELTRVPRCATLPRFDGPALGGCLYVIEGAALGGRVVSRALEARLGLGPAGGASFFRGEPCEAERFPAVLAWLAALGADADAIVAGARATFVAFDGWLSRELPRG